jgi:hypothetical protein
VLLVVLDTPSCIIIGSTSEQKGAMMARSSFRSSVSKTCAAGLLLFGGTGCSDTVSDANSLTPEITVNRFDDGASSSSLPDTSMKTDTSTSNGPLRDLLDLVGGRGMSADESQRFAVAQHDSLQESIAVWVREQGFNYQPIPYDEGIVGTVSGYEPENRNWVAQWGFAIVMSPEGDTVVHGTLVEDPTLKC